MSPTLEYTSQGIDVGGVTVTADDMADWFEAYREVEEYFPADHDDCVSQWDHDDCVSQWDHERALNNQRVQFEQNLPEPVRNYHDDERHTGAVKWCKNPACEIENAKEAFDGDVRGW